jgi:hypothetical protein
MTSVSFNIGFDFKHWTYGFADFSAQLASVSSYESSFPSEINSKDVLYELLVAFLLVNMQAVLGLWASRECSPSPPSPFTLLQSLGVDEVV